jgi:hypothetical protein
MLNRRRYASPFLDSFFSPLSPSLSDSINQHDRHPVRFPLQLVLVVHFRTNKLLPVHPVQGPIPSLFTPISPSPPQVGSHVYTKPARLLVEKGIAFNHNPPLLRDLVFSQSSSPLNLSLWNCCIHPSLWISVSSFAAPCLSLWSGQPLPGAVRIYFTTRVSGNIL